jgi:alpha-L-fucosidase
MGSQSEAQSRELRDLVHRLQPQCQVSSRIGNDMGDFTVMGDNQEPDYTIGVPWQSPASFFDDTWGYRSWQKRGSEEDKVKEKLASLIRVVSRGGNYLLNIGPKDDGSVVPFEKNVLLAIGAWLEKNGEAIYATDPDPFQVSFDWGNITTRGNKMYLHVLDLPKGKTITLPGLEGEIKDAYVLTGRMKVEALRKSNTVTIHLPATFSVEDEYKVIVLEFTKPYTVNPARVVAEASGKITLSSRNAFKHYSSSGIDYNTRFRSTVKESWSISPQHNDTYTPSLYYTEGDKGKTIDVVINGSEFNVKLEGGESVKDGNVLSPVEWGPLYLAGPFWAGLEGSNGDTRDLDPAKLWPDNDERKAWIQQTGWRRGEVQSPPAEAMNAYYFLQEIVSPKDQALVVRITTGDGVVVFVNGEEQLTDNNPQKEKQQVNVLLIHLRKGRNQVLIKSFNNFQKQVLFSLEPHPSQLLYRKKLDPIPLKKDRISTASWRLHNPATSHQTILLQNLSLTLERTKEQ